MTLIISPHEGVEYPSNLGRDLEPDVEIFFRDLRDPATGEMVPFPCFSRDGKDVPALRVLSLRAIVIRTGQSRHTVYRKAANGDLIGRLAPRRKDGTFAKKGRIEVDRDVFLAAFERRDQVIQQRRDRRREVEKLKQQVESLSMENTRLRQYLAAIEQEVR